MPLFKHAQPSTDEPEQPEGLPIPDHLEPYWDAAAGPTEAESRGYWLSPPQTIPLRQGAAHRGQFEPLDASVDVPYAKWAHEIRLRNAAALKAKDDMADAVAASLFDCGLCEQETWIGDSSPLLLDNGQTVRLCVVCYPLMRDALWLRRHAARLDELLGTTG